MIGIKFDPKKMFFDSAYVKKRVSDATRRVLSKFGAFVRQTAQKSIVNRKQRSQPGQPPHSHKGTLRRSILFGYDAAKKSVVIGPRQLTSKLGDAPPALEYGGTSRIVRGRGRGRQVRPVTIAARPFMTPAFEREKKVSLPAMWRDSVKP